MDGYEPTDDDRGILDSDPFSEDIDEGKMDIREKIAQYIHYRRSFRRWDGMNEVEKTFEYGIADQILALLKEEGWKSPEDIENMSDYDPGLLNDYGGGNVGWWRDYIRTVVNSANEWWKDQLR